MNRLGTLDSYQSLIQSRVGVVAALVVLTLTIHQYGAMIASQFISAVAWIDRQIIIATHQNKAVFVGVFAAGIWGRH